MTKGHFHCIECGALFKAEIVALKKQRCSVCGHPPTGKKLAVTAQLKVDTLDHAKEQQNDSTKRIKRKKKKNHAIFVMLVTWALLMGLTVGLVKYFSAEEDEGRQVDNSAERERLQLEIEKKQAAEVMKAALPECEKAITQFMNAVSAGAKAQFVYQGRELATEMSRYYSKNPTFSATRSVVKIRNAQLLQNTSNQVIGGLCVNAEGEFFEAIFVHSEGEWKIDWQALVRFDTKQWSLFPSGNDGDEGEFRLYMRVRDSNKQSNSDTINLVFYKPEIYFKETFSGTPSSTVRVATDSDEGKLILKLTAEDAQSKKDEFGSSMKSIDPAGYHRVRVKMKLHKEESESRLELLEFLSTHWYGDGVVEAQKEIAE